VKTLRKVVKGIDTFSLWLGNFVAFFVVFLIAITIYDITFRQFGLFTMWAFDVEWFTYAFILMLAMGYSTYTRQHVRIDLITVRFSPWFQELIMALSYILIIIPLMVFIAIYGWHFAYKAYLIKEITLVAWGAPIWPIKFFIFIGCVLMLPQCFAELTRHIYFLVKKETL